MKKGSLVRLVISPGKGNLAKSEDAYWWDSTFMEMSVRAKDGTILHLRDALLAGKLGTNPKTDPQTINWWGCERDAGNFDVQVIQPARPVFIADGGKITFRGHSGAIQIRPRQVILTLDTAGEIGYGNEDRTGTKKSYPSKTTITNTSRFIMKPILRLFITLPILLPLALHADDELTEPPTSWKYPPKMQGSRVEVYRQVGDVKLNAWIFEPKGHQASDRRAAVVFFFGGGWRGGTPGQFLPQCLHLAKRGMVAISVDYRVKSRHGVKPQDCVRDAKAAIRWVRANASRLGIDPDRIVASGGSAGGHLAAAVGLVPGFEDGEHLKVSSVPNAMVLYNPGVVLAAVEGHPDVVSVEKLDSYNERTGDQARKISPYHYIRAGLPPSIIFHGTNDEAVPFATVSLFAKTMTAAGNRCELKAYKGQPHGFFNPGRGEGKPREEATRYYYKTLSELDAFLVSLGYLKPER